MSCFHRKVTGREHLKKSEGAMGDGNDVAMGDGNDVAGEAGLRSKFQGQQCSRFFFFFFFYHKFDFISC